MVLLALSCRCGSLPVASVGLEGNKYMSRRLDPWTVDQDLSWFILRFLTTAVHYLLLTMFTKAGLRRLSIKMIGKGPDIAAARPEQPVPSTSIPIQA